MFRTFYLAGFECATVFNSGKEWIDQIEATTGLPVVTCVQAQVHACLTRAGYHRPIEGYGRLLRQLGEAVPA